MIYFIIACLIVFADQIVKYAVTLEYGLGGSWDIIPGFIRITYHTNTGGAFSMLNNYTMILSIVSAVVCVLIIIALIRCKWSAWGRLALAFILGGAVGNLIDRFIMGYVVDMIMTLFVNFAIFNVADIFITIGAVLLVLFILFGDKRTDLRDPDGHKLTAAQRKERIKMDRFGPDVDESTIIIPSDEIRAAEDKLRQEAADGIETEAEDATVIYRSPILTDSDIAKATAEKEAAKEKTEFSLDDILREYGSDI